MFFILLIVVPGGERPTEDIEGEDLVEVEKVEERVRRVEVMGKTKTIVDFFVLSLLIGMSQEEQFYEWHEDCDGHDDKKF